MESKTMRKSVIPAIVALAVLAGSAVAAASTATGTISSLDPTAHKLKLSSGETFMLPASFKTGQYKVGEKVKVSYVKQNGGMQATQIVRE
jgi:hypothetical protein